MSFRPESLGANDEQDVADEEATTFDLDDEQIGGDWIFGKKDSLLSENPSANQLRDSGYRKVFATRRKEPGSPWDSLELKRVTDKCALQDNRGGWHAHAGIFALRAVDFYTQLWLENLDLKEDDRYWEAIDAALFAFRVGDSVKDCECYWIKERA